MRHIVFYTKENCQLCDNARELLNLLKDDYPYEMEERDIYTNDEWLEKYQLMIPVVELGDVTLDCEEINYDSLEKALKQTK
ncbi:glutaredoxin family protein [Virgibacillus doumboii]|uniref:glutaredoxin family protein n=1 Tax=Virgibacillus doumboii TaxID=2697503 RepID=UPI0013DED9ED|nr:glutaredoxin family protein [Virgibacillus doumboii]